MSQSQRRHVKFKQAALYRKVQEARPLTPCYTKDNVQLKYEKSDGWLNIEKYGDMVAYWSGNRVLECMRDVDSFARLCSF